MRIPVIAIVIKFQIINSSDPEIRQLIVAGSESSDASLGYVGMFAFS